MAWMPLETFVDGRLDNRTPGKVTGWMRFWPDGENPVRVPIRFAGNFGGDLRGKAFRFIGSLESRAKARTWRGRAPRKRGSQSSKARG